MTTYFKNTKQLYCDTLLRMCERMELNSITATALIRESGTARQTFYNHFKDINDLISYLPLDYLATSGFEFVSIENVRSAYEYALGHKSFFSQLPHHKGQNNFRETFIAALEKKFCQAIMNERTSEEMTLRAMMSIKLVVSGIVDLFLAWCKEDLTWPIDDHLAVIAEYLAALNAESPSKREQRFEAMLDDIQSEYDQAAERIKAMTSAGKTKGATFQQLLATKMSYQKMLSLYRSYDLIEGEHAH